MNRTAHTAQLHGAGIETLTEWGRQAFASIGQPAPVPEAGKPPVATGQLWQGLKRAFATLTNNGECFALMPCSVNGQPGGLIVCYQPCERGIEIVPMFVSLAPGLTITDPDGDVLYGPPKPN